MSFTWTSVTQSVTKVAPGHLNEIKTATDTLSGKLGVGNYSWSGRFPLSQNSKVSYADLNELRSGLNYVHDSNICAGHNADKDTTINATRYATDNNNVETGNNATQYSSNNSAPWYSSNNATDHTTNNNNVETGNNATQHSSKNTNVETGNNATDYNTRLALPHNATYCVTQNTSVK